MTLGALRGLDRWGAHEVVERAFAGFAALPSGDTDPRVRPWRDVLGGTWPDGLDPEELFALAKNRHRKAMETQHPDVGGNGKAAADLNIAIAQAKAELMRSL